MVEYVGTGTVHMETRGSVPEGAVELARDRVAALLRLAKEPVMSARVKLTVRTEPGLPRLAVAQANLDVDGRPLRAQATAETMWRAVNELRDRMLIRLARVSRDWQLRRGSRPLTTTREWRPAGVPGRRPPDLSPRAAGQHVVRHKVIKPLMETPLEAALDMELLDYDFYLFTDAVTGDDCVVDRNGTKYRVVRLVPDVGGIGGGRGKSGQVMVDDDPAPVLTPAQALGRLTARNLAYVFFSDPETHGSRIVYRRYDGHYGMITACPL
jgi:hypothetical protein